MKYNSVKQSQAVILSTKPPLTQPFVLHTSLIFHLHIIFLYLFALGTWNVTDLSVSEETGEGRAVLQPLLCLCSRFLHLSAALEKAPTPLCSPFLQDAPLLLLQDVNKMQIIIIFLTTEVRVILFISKITDSSAKTLMFFLYRQHC